MAAGRWKLAKQPCLVVMVTAFLLLVAVQLPLVWESCCQATDTRCPPSSPPHFLHTFPHREWGPNKEKLVLLATTFFGSRAWFNMDEADPQAVLRGCPQPRCRLTWDQDLLETSDAVLFHARDLSWWGRSTFPAARHPHQVWTLVNLEPPPHLPVDLSRLNNLFNWTLSYRSDSDVFYDIAHFVRRDVRPVGTATGETTGIPGGRGSARETAGSSRAGGETVKKTKPVAWMASNCMDHARRRRWVRALSQYIQVDTFGACGERTPNCSGHLCADVLTRYKFYLSFENSLCRDYVTEKLWNAYLRGQVPVVLGGANYSALLPPHSYIDVADFASMRELGQYLAHLDKDDQAYSAYLQWRHRYQVVQSNFYCSLCAQLHNRSKPAQVYSDLQAWFVHGELASCPQFTVPNYLSRFLDSMLITLGVK